MYSEWASAALSKSGAYHLGLVSVFCCLLRPLPLQGGNKHRSTRSRSRNVQGWSICPSIPRLFSPYLIYVCSRNCSLDAAAAPSVLWQNGRRVIHWGDPDWRQVESAAYLVDASWCNEHNGDGQLQNYDSILCIQCCCRLQSHYRSTLMNWRTSMVGMMKQYLSLINRSLFATR